MAFRNDLRRPDRDNATDQFLLEDLSPAAKRLLATNFTEEVQPFPPDQKAPCNEFRLFHH